MNICQRCVMLHVPMALAFKEMSNTGRSDGNPAEQSSLRADIGKRGGEHQTAASGGAAETTREKSELLTEQSEVDNNGYIFFAAN